MIYIILSVFCSVIIANLLKIFTSGKKNSILVIFLGNYFFAAIFSLFTNDTPFNKINPSDIILGSFAGFFLLTNFLIYKKNIQINGLSLSVSVMRSSLLIPIILALVLWNETIKSLNVLGIIVVLISFVLMSGKKHPHNLLWLFTLFCFTGTTDLFFKLYNVYGINSINLFLFFAFSTSLFLNIILIFIQKIQFNWKEFSYGLILGLPNQLTALFFMKALNILPASIAYPVLASSVVIVTYITDIFIWKTKFTKKEGIIFIIILLGIILLNIN